MSNFSSVITIEDTRLLPVPVTNLEEDQSDN